MKVLAVDVGGTHLKVLASGRKTERVSEQILDLDRDNAAVEWEEKKEKKAI